MHESGVSLSHPRLLSPIPASLSLLSLPSQTALYPGNSVLTYSVLLLGSPTAAALRNNVAVVPGWA